MIRVLRANLGWGWFCYRGGMGAESVCHQHPGKHITVRLGTGEGEISSLRPEMAAVAHTLQVVPLKTDLLYLCYSETALDKVTR